MIKFERMESFNKKIGEHIIMSTYSVTETLELDLSNFDEILNKATSLVKDGWYECHITSGKYHLIVSDCDIHGLWY